MNQAVIGINAGIVWRTMDSARMRQCWSFTELKKDTGLSDIDLYAAIGWLAREGKLEFVTNTQTAEDEFCLSLHYYF